jgi:SAM-dependent MidA family methyltransferase
MATDPVAPHDPGLRSHLAALSAANGFVPFDRFMETALYADDVGYYTRPRSPLGPKGDFYTAPDVSPLFSASFAARIHRLRASELAGRPFTLVELGPGEGHLAAGILRELGGLEAGVAGMRVVLVERSPRLRASAHRQVREVAGPLGVEVRLVGSVGELGPFEGAVLSNELFDAQPVRRLRWTGTEWRELGVKLEVDRIVEADAPIPDAVSGPELPANPAPGTTVEVSPYAEALVREVADHLVRGIWLLDDYGMEEDELVRGHPGGTLTAVRGHRTITDPLEAPGHTDLSTFVNWTRLRAVARAAGLAVVEVRSQAEALTDWGLPALMERELARGGSSEAQVRVRLGAKSLLFGFERFRILELAPAGSRPSIR